VTGAALAAAQAEAAALVTAGKVERSKMNQNLDELVRRLVEAHGADLISVILYGSVIHADGEPRRSDVQLMVVMRALPAVQLARSAPVMRWWMEAGFPRAAYFTESELANALDVFPIDFTQMRRAYRVLYGRDVLETAEISRAHIRLLVEYELRGKLVRLRGLYLSTAGDSRRTLQLMTDSVVSFVQFLRPILELHGETAPVGRRETVHQIAKKLQIDMSPFERVLRLRHEKQDLAERKSQALMNVEIEDLFSSYMDCVEDVIDAVDQIT